MLLSALTSGSMVTIIITLVAGAFLIFCAIPLHEFSHAYVAYKMGDKTAKLSGQLTLNPLVHIDPVGAVLLLLTGFGWGRPTPVDSRNFKDERKGIALTAVAGPLSNLLLGWLLIFLSAVVANIPGLPYLPIGNALYLFCRISAQISIYLAVLNLLPIPPFDGFRVASVFMSQELYYKVMMNQQMISIVFIVLIFSRVLTIPLSLLADLFIKLFDYISWVPFTVLLG